MANPRRFEGENLEQLLEQVRSTLGENARIIAADRVRKGGVGGFFAREVFEVVAEAAIFQTLGSLPGSTDAIVVEPSPAGAALGWLRASGPADGDAAVAAQVRERMHGSSRRAPSDAAEAILDLAEAVNEVERERAALRAAGAAMARVSRPEPFEPDAAPLAAPAVSTESPTFASILARLSDDTELVITEPADATWNAGTTSDTDEPRSFAEALRRQHDDSARDMIDIRTGDTDTAGGSARDDDKLGDDSRDDYALDVDLDRLIHDDDEGEPMADLEPVIQAFVPRRIERSALRDGQEVSEPASAPTEVPHAVAHSQPSPASVQSAVAPHQVAATAAVDDVFDRPEMALRKLGIPARLIPRGVARNDLTKALTATFGALPQPAALPATRGVVVAIVGARSYELARTLGREWGVDTQSIVFATPQPPADTPEWLVITDEESARERRYAWQRREHPTIVVVDEPRTDRTDASWIHRLLDRLEPTQTWMLVDARSKTEDMARAIEAIGGVDALALTDADATVSPASVLELGIAVGRIGADAATPAAWARHLTDRLAQGLVEGGPDRRGAHATEQPELARA